MSVTHHIVDYSNPSHRTLIEEYFRLRQRVFTSVRGHRQQFPLMMPLDEQSHYALVLSCTSAQSTPRVIGGMRLVAAKETQQIPLHVVKGKEFVDEVFAQLNIAKDHLVQFDSIVMDNHDVDEPLLGVAYGLFSNAIAWAKQQKADYIIAAPRTEMIPLIKRFLQSHNITAQTLGEMDYLNAEQTPVKKALMIISSAKRWIPPHNAFILEGVNGR